MRPAPAPTPTAATSPTGQCPTYITNSRVTKKLGPGAGGTLKALRRHGAALLCVRYRRDPLNLYRIKTVELVVQAQPVNIKRFDRASFGLALKRNETDLRNRLKAAGARWDPQDQLWWTPGHIIRTWGLMDRIECC